jgi:hypothetical protein
MEQFIAFCEENGLDPMKRASKNAYDASLSPDEGGRRSYNAKTVTLVATAENAEGEQLFRIASGIETRDRKNAASVLRWTLETEDGASNVAVHVSGETL